MTVKNLRLPPKALGAEEEAQPQAGPAASSPHVPWHFPRLCVHSPTRGPQPYSSQSHQGTASPQDRELLWLPSSPPAPALALCPGPGCRRGSRQSPGKRLGRGLPSRLLNAGLTLCPHRAAAPLAELSVPAPSAPTLPSAEV